MTPQTKRARISPLAVTLGSLLILGTALTAVNYQLPIVRNSLIYAKICDALLGTGQDIPAKDKALGFPIVSLPFVALFGANGGLKLSSYAASVLYLLSLLKILPYFKRRYFSGDPTFHWELFLIGGSPLFVAQFFSGYPDILFAFFFAWCWYYLDRGFSEKGSARDICVAALLVLLSVWVKHYGLYPVLRCGSLPGWRRSASRSPASGCLGRQCEPGIVVALPGSAGDTAALQSWRGRGRLQVRVGALASFRTALYGLACFVVFLAVSFGVFSALSLRFSKWKERGILYVAVVGYIVPVLVYPGSTYNIRYYLPIAFIFGLVVGDGAGRLLSPGRAWLQRSAKVLAIGWVVVGNAYFNFPHGLDLPMWRASSTRGVATGRAYAWLMRKYYDWFDNFRVNTEQVPDAKVLEVLGRTKEKGQALFLLRFTYGSYTAELWPRMGLIPSEYRITYGKRPEDVEGRLKDGLWVLDYQGGFARYLAEHPGVRFEEKTPYVWHPGAGRLYRVWVGEGRGRVAMGSERISKVVTGWWKF